MKRIFIFIAILQTVLGQYENIADDDDQDLWAEHRSQIPPPPPTIRKMNITSQVCNRYAITTVQSYVNNPSDEGQETNFTMLLPKNAFISSFIIKTKDEIFQSKIKNPEDAKHSYGEAIRKGQTAGHVAVRDINMFEVSVHIESKTEAEFVLMYEELLDRKDDKYELVINIFPGQIIGDLSAKVTINETRPIINVEIPLVRSGQQIQTKYNQQLISPARVSTEETTATINFKVTPKQQKKFAQELGTKESAGLAAQFAVKYDVIREKIGGELLLQDNYFVHYLSLDELTPFPKHLIFVLDVSGSMKEPIKKTNKNEENTTKLQQLQNAMEIILGSLSPEDVFTIIPFTHFPYVLDFKNKKKIRITIGDYKDPFKFLEKSNFPSPVTKKDVDKAKEIIRKFKATGGTDIAGALETALAAAKFSPSQSESKKNVQPLITILTDGKPYGAVRNTKNIIDIVTELNQKNQKVPIYTLSFGDKADKNFLRLLSVKNSGIFKHIHDESDASLQLYEFYKDISRPLLTNVEFDYKKNKINIDKKQFPMLFKGSEIAVCGFYNGTDDLSKLVTIRGVGVDGDVTLQPEEIEPATMSLERLCGYLTVKQKLNERRILGDNSTDKMIFELAKKYSFVTEVTSLIVEKPRPRLRFNKKFGIWDSNVATETSQDESKPLEDEYDFAESDKSSDLWKEFEAELPWLKKELDNTNILKKDQKSYLLGENYKTLSDNDCISMSNQETGKCTLLKDCPDVWPMLKNHTVYYDDYFCIIDKIYAGVCCI